MPGCWHLPRKDSLERASLLLVSGGHCQCIAVEGVGRHARLGGTVDDAAGEAFSFSGLKTAVAQEVARHGTGALPRRLAADIAASFQAAVVDVLADRATHAMALFGARYGGRLLVVAGGVAANGAVWTGLERAATAHGFRLAVPPVRLCTDNAVMVAWTGVERLRLGLMDGLEVAARPRWALGELSAGG